MIKLKLNSGNGQGRQILLLLLFFLLTPLFIFAQKSVSGVITSEDGEPLIGANVLVQGTDIGTITGIDGSYTLDNVPEDAVIVISFIGYDSQEIGVAGRNDIDVIVTATGELLEELVVTGYSVEKKKDLLGAVSVVNVDDLADVGYSNALHALQGRVAGVFVGVPGNVGQGTDVKIRGVSTLGNNSPLYIIDGVPLQQYTSVTASTTQTASRWDLAWLNPNDIESIQVLKDASSASIYGARASNGVVIITTKQPERGRSTVTFNARFGVEEVTDGFELATSEEKARIQWQAAVNDGADPDAGGRYRYDWHFDPSLGPGIQGNGVPVLDRIIYPEWLDEADQLRPSGHPASMWTGTEFGGASLEAGTDWNDAIYENGLVQNYDFSLSQGSEKGGVHLGLNFFEQQGTVIQTGYNRFGIRLNSNYSFANNRVTIGQNLAVSQETRQWTDNGFGGTVEILNLVMKPILPVKTEDGRFAGPPGAGFDDRDNPVGLADDNRDDRLDNSKVFGNVYVNWDLPFEGLSFRSNFGIDYDNINSRDIFRTYSRGFLSNTTAELTNGNLRQTNWVWNNTLTYSKIFDQHSVTVLGGIEAIKNQINEFSATGKEFALESKEYFHLGVATGESTVFGTATGFSLLSYFGKANYNLADKYLASFTIRRDGSSRFGTNNLYGIFPAASVGWRLSEEAFFQDVSWLSSLKIRVGWGKTGNQDILNEARFALYRAIYAPSTIILPWGGGCAQTLCNTASTSYDISNQGSGILPSGFIGQQTANDELKWETTTELNIGMDFGFIDDRIFGSFEYFNKKTEDILIQPSFIGTFGDGASRWANGATMETKGWELLIGYSSQIGRDLSYSISFNGAAYDDVITELPEDLWSSYPGNVEQNIIGQSPSAIFGYVVEGILQTPEEAASAPRYNNIRVGGFRYADLNGDGVINASDQEYQGVDGRAGMEYGINGQLGWKNFDLTLQFFGMTGRKLRDAGASYTELVGDNPGFNSGSRGLYGAWSYTNTDTHIPALTTFNPALSPTSWATRAGNFLNFRQFTLGYTLPQTAMGSVLSNLRVYVSAENIAYWYNKSGPNGYTWPSWLIDTQTSSQARGAFSRYPKPRRISLGVDIGF